MPELSASSLVVRLFGPFEASVHGDPLPRLHSRKGQWLFALLALRAGCAIERAWLVATLWPDSTEAAGFPNLRTTLKDLRRALGPEAGRLRSPTTRTLSLELAGADVDLLAFDAAVAQGDPASLQRAVALYRGPLLEGCAEEWVFQERQVREHAYLTALETLAEQALAGGDPLGAERYLRRAVAVDPLRESAQRGLMQALATGGNDAAVLLVYRELRQRLHREVNAEPDGETQALFQQLRAQARSRARPSASGGGNTHHPAAPARASAGERTAERVSPRTDPDPTADFPPWQPLNVRPHHLPVPPTPLLGREEQVAAACGWLKGDSVRLLTLTGAGGSGKTRLALQVAAELLDDFPDGVVFVDLAPVRDPNLVAPIVARTLGVSETTGQPLIESLQSYLREQQLLLLLDNFEQILPAAPLVSELLAAAPRLKVLVTSRAALRLRGEQEFPVPPLPVPPLVDSLPLRVESPGRVTNRSRSDLSTLNSPLSTLTQYAAVELFRQRAVNIQPDFALTRDNSAAVAAICCRVDGLPLAIELAAARIRYFSPAVLLSRLDSRLELLSGGPRDLPERQLTLRNTIAWSYDLLSEDEKRLFRRLSVFVGGCTLDAAEAIGSETGDPERSTLDGVLSLVDWNVLQREQNGEGQLRFSMLETIREFGLECLAASGEEAAVRERHQRLFLALAEQAEPELRGPDQDVWFQRLEKEHDNLRGALDWSLSAGDPDLGLRLGGALGWFWATRGYGYGQEGGRWLTALLARAGPAVRTMGRAKALLAAAGLSQRNTPMAAEALALCRELGHRPGVALALLYLGSAARWRGDWREAEALWEQSLALARDLGDPWLMLRSLDWLGNFIWSQRDPSRAAALFEESVSLSREIGDTRALAIALGSLGELRTDQGNDDRARPLLEESLALAREAGEPFLVTLALYRLGRMAAEHGDVDCAVPLLEESLALARDRKMLGPLAHSLRARAFLAERQGQPAQAAKLYRESLALEQQLGRPEVIPEGLVGLGRAAATQGQAERAARLWGAAEALREQRGIPPPPTRAQDEQCRALAQRTLGEAAFAAAWAAGRAMPLSEAMACVSQRTSGDSPVK